MVISSGMAYQGRTIQFHLQETLFPVAPNCRKTIRTAAYAIPGQQLLSPSTTILPVRLTGSSSQNLEMLGHCYRTQQHSKSHDKGSDDTESLLRIVGYRVQDPEGSYEHSKARSHYKEGYDFVPVPVVFVDGSVRFEMGVIMVKSLLHGGIGHG